MIELSPNARYVARLENTATTAVAQRLADLMDREGLSAREVSRRTRVAINTVRTVLSGERTPRLGNLVALSAGLGITLDQLLGETSVETLAAAVQLDERATGAVGA